MPNQKWIKCSEKMPEDCEKVLCCNSQGETWVAWFNFDGFEWTTWPDIGQLKDDFQYSYDFIPVYWTPILDTPEILDEKDEEEGN
jgi:hypothetical protein